MRVQFNDGQEILDSDLNDAIKLLEKAKYERLLYRLTNQDSNAFFQDSFFVDYVSSTGVSVRAGMGVQTDNTQTGTETTKRLVWATAATSKAISAAHPTLPRIDTLCIKATRATTATQSRNVKDYTTQNIAPQSLITQTDWSCDIQVVAGTPNASPVAPSPTAGYLQLATVYVTAATGVANQAAITDSRALLSVGEELKVNTSAYVASGSTKSAATKLKQILLDHDNQINALNALAYDAVVGTSSYCTHSTLAAAIAAVSAGATILIANDQTINTTVTLNKANVELIFKNAVQFIKGTASTGLSITASGCRVRGGKFTGFSGGSDKAISVDSTNGTLCLIRDLRFSGNTTDIDDAGQNVTSYGIING